MVTATVEAELEVDLKNQGGPGGPGGNGGDGRSGNRPGDADVGATLDGAGGGTGVDENWG